MVKKIMPAEVGMEMYVIKLNAVAHEPDTKKSQNRREENGTEKE